MEDKYKSSGKQYNNEKAIISLTSWKARIETASKTLFSLIKMCPGFHIVLVLSEEEFPKMEKELPKNLMLFVDNNLIELLWVYKNYKSFKKVLFTMDKYKDVPVISADDDCVYTYNYADYLYKKMKESKNSIIGMAKSMGSGYGIIFPPYAYKEYGIKFLDNEELIKVSHDDLYYRILAKKLNINFFGYLLIKDLKKIMRFHDEISSISSTTLAIDEKNRKLYDSIIDIH